MIDMYRHLYKRFLAKIRSRPFASDFDFDGCCSKIRFDIFGECIEILCRFLFFNSYVYIEDVLVGYFYGRSLGFWRATNCTFRLGKNKIRFRSVKGGVRVFNAWTKECLLLCAPRNKLLSRFRGEMKIVLTDNSEILIDQPKVIDWSGNGMPTYANCRFDNGLIIRVLLYGRGCKSMEGDARRCFYSVIHNDDVERLPEVYSRISLPMLLSIAMYLRMYQYTRWLI